MPKNDLLRRVTYGMISGVVGTMVLEQISSLMYRFENPEKKKREEAIRKESPYDTMARRIAKEVMHADLGDEDIALLGQLLHWGYGIAWGAIYGIVRDRLPAMRKAAGLPFGVAFALIGDEVLNVALKLTPPPQAYPIDAHIRGLVAHLAYAASAEGVMQTLEHFESPA